MPVSLSVVIPIYNERDNIELLHQSLTSALDPCGRTYELIFVNDGSRDGSSERLEALARRDRRVKIVEFRRNFGQTAAMQAGIQHAGMDYVVTIDGDLQNDPTDIPRMVDKLEEGYDLVHGWRKQRQDAFVNRKLPSKIANRLIAKVTGFPVNDLGCTLKVIRREIAQELQLYGEMHRFIPILAHWNGARCVEVETKHHPRKFGTTKYGIGRTFRVVLDLLTVQFLTRYSASPMKLFGGLGLGVLGGGLAAVAATIAMKLLAGIDMTGNPLLLAGVLGTIVGIQFFVLGLLGEVCSRIYFACRDRPPYAVRRLVNFDDATTTTTLPRRAA
jgi:glycosyltransferase involved in cell wall biosynthesis